MNDLTIAGLITITAGIIFGMFSACTKPERNIVGFEEGLTFATIFIGIFYVILGLIMSHFSMP